MDYQTISSVAREYFERSAFGALIVLLLSIPLGIFSALVTYFLIDGAFVLAVVLVLSFGISLLALGVFLRGFNFSLKTLGDFANISLDKFEQSVNVTNNIAVKGKGNVIAVSNTPTQSQEVVRLVPVKSSARLIAGVDENDLRAFVDGIFVRGFSQRAWMGQALPSGRVLESFADYDSFIQPLLTSGVIVDRKERSAGKLVYQSSAEVKEVLGL